MIYPARAGFASVKCRPCFGRGGADCQKNLPGGLEGRSPPSSNRIRRHARRIRLLAQQAFLTLFPAREPLGGERETALYTRKRTPQADFFDTLCRPCFGRGGAVLASVLRFCPSAPRRGQNTSSRVHVRARRVGGACRAGGASIGAKEGRIFEQSGISGNSRYRRNGA